ncbi:glycosyltransferase family 2 protein [Litchfieldia salsa]|uniref:Glycosyltransferase EpsH n=1 Tax=Litchfieldia salsa TaxID=930152 RepID=A0A1H0VEA5_9BACI|nr:glycosyltransferase [Litchfieldia salsa]SDP76691.1 glycosyltransferase EpsH [Litchfieldia salsa]
MRPKISIIVPIYNVEQYLNRCFNSLLSQTLKDIEIIAVNDGSTDSSLKTVEQLAANDNRIVVIDKVNGGVSSARNEGLSKANGEYIGFVDPDDWVDSTMYETLYSIAEREKSDIVMCSYMREFGSHSKEKKFNLPEKTTFHNEEVRDKVLRRLVGPINEEIANPELLDAWGTVWSKLYKTEIIKNNKIQFKDLQEIGSNEDSLFNIEAVYHAKTFTFFNRPFYHYWRANIASETSGYKPDLMKKWFKLYKHIELFLDKHEMKEEYYQALNNRICLNTLGLGLNTISHQNNSSMLHKMRKIREFLNNQRIKGSFKQFDLSVFPFVWRIFYSLAKVRSVIGFYFALIGIEQLRKIVR